MTTRHGRRLRGGIVAAALLAACAATASAGDVRIVLSSKARPYVMAFRGARAALLEAEHDPIPVMLETLKEDPSSVTEDDTLAYLAIGTEAAEWLREQGIPSDRLCYCMVASPEEHGLTGEDAPMGVSMQIPVAEQFALIARALPDARSVGMLYRRDDEQSAASVADARAALPEGWELRTVAMEDHASAAEAIDALYGAGVDMVWTAADPSIYTKVLVRALLLKGLRNRTPVYGFSIPFVRAGALVGAGIDPQTHGAQAGELLAEALDKSASDMSDTTSVESEVGSEAEQSGPVAPAYQTAVNLAAAKSLNVRLPEEAVREADVVVGQDR